MLIPTQKNIRTITDMREDAFALLQMVQKNEEPTIIFHHNCPKAVMLSVQSYNQLMDLLEDYRDAEIVRELEKEKSKKKDYIPFAKIAKKYKIKV